MKPFNDGDQPSRSRLTAPRTVKRWVSISFVALLAGTWSSVPRVVAQNTQAPAAGSETPLESAGPEYRSATDAQQVELLRRLLGVKAPVSVPAPVQVAPPTVPEPAVQPAVAVETAPEPAPKEPAKSTPAKSAPKPKSKPVVKPKPAPAKPRPAAQPAKPAPAAPSEPTEVEASAPTPAAPAVEAKAATGSAEVQETDLPPAGTVITAANSERWAHLLTPSMRWAVDHGLPIEVGETDPIEMEPPRAEATERYHAQVQLTADKKGLRNYVAGIPFPDVTEDDPDAAVKLIYNFENRILYDDFDIRDFRCDTGLIDTNTGFEIERAYRNEHFRRLYYVGRLLVDPKPVWATPDGLHHRESIGPLSEPFDLKGAGFSYSRYLDSGRQDDSWLYFPQQKRVRRLSTAQRSEGIFGQDVDLDSYAGFAGNPAWFDWQLLGKKTLLAPYHPKHIPIKWAAKPADFLFEDVWEPRETYVLAARSQLKGYNFSLRIIYVDAQSFLIPYTEVYDNDGQLWRAYVQMWNAEKDRFMPKSEEAVYPFKTTFLAALSVFDMQQMHSTRCSFSNADGENKEAWFLWWGKKSGGTVPEDFDVAAFISQGR